MIECQLGMYKYLFEKLSGKKVEKLVVVQMDPKKGGVTEHVFTDFELLEKKIYAILNKHLRSSVVI